MLVSMKNPKTGEVKSIKVGFSWVLFLWSGVFGLPLFLRKLNVWGGIFLVLWIINLVVPSMMDEQSALGLSIIFFVIFLGLQIFMGIKGNEMTAKNYLENGWEFTNNDAEEVKHAKMKWGILI